MKKYNVEYWEKQTVWVRQRVAIETDEKPTPENMEKLLANENVDFLQSDYSWETSDTSEYDFNTDFEAEEA